MDQRNIIRLPVQYFAEGVPVEETAEHPAEQSAPQPEGKPGEADSPGPSEEGKTFTRDEVNRMISAEKAKAREAAAAEFQARQAEAEKLAKMKEDERAAYEKQQAERRAAEAEAQLNAYRLKDEAVKIANETKLPLSFLNNIDFRTATAQQVSERIDAMTADFNRAVVAEVNARLKQPAPQTHAPAAGSGDLERQLADAQARNDMTAIAYYSRLIAQQKP